MEIESFAKKAGIPDRKKANAFRAIDKLDKIGEEGVMREMKSYGIPTREAKSFLKLIKSGKPEMKELKELENEIICNPGPLAKCVASLPAQTRRAASRP